MRVTDKQLKEAMVLAESRLRELESDRVQLRSDIKAMERVLGVAVSVQTSMQNLAYRYEHRSTTDFSEQYALNIQANAKLLLTNLRRMLEFVEQEATGWKQKEKTSKPKST